MSRVLQRVQQMLQQQRAGQPLAGQQMQQQPEQGMPISSFYNPQGGGQSGSLTDMLQASPQQGGGFDDLFKKMAMQRSASNVQNG